MTSWEMTRLIGFRCKCGNTLSQEVLISQRISSIVFLFFLPGNKSVLSNFFSMLGASGERDTPDPILHPAPIFFKFIVVGVTGERDTPDPIPNSEVKPLSADGSRKVRVG